MNRLTVIFFISLINLSFAYSQRVDPGFAKYLTDKAYYEDIIQLGQLNWGHLEKNQLDTMNYYSGWAYYNLQMLSEGVSSFSAVSQKSVFFNASRFFASWSELYLGHQAEAMSYLDQTINSSPAEKELLHLFMISGSLMQREIHRTDSLLSLFKKSNPVYRPQWDRMDQHYQRLADFNPKSYGIAGVLSGIIPGSGKFYAGQKGAGISSFLLAGGLAAISLENGFKTGWGKWNTLLTAGIFTIFYVGNIYGSIVSVRVYRERFYNELDRAILLDINIPLRNIYR